AVVRVQVVAAARAADQVAVVQQALVDQRHGVARHGQLLRQLAARGQRLVGREPAAQNGRHQRLTKLFLQAALAVEIQVVEVVDHGVLLPQTTQCQSKEQAIRPGQNKGENCPYRRAILPLYGDDESTAGTGCKRSGKSLSPPLEYAP